MYGPFTIGYKYLKYWLTASNGRGHGIHSPFVFRFVEQVLNDRVPYPEYRKIESLRKKLMKSTEEVAVEDLGAGSSSGKKHIRKVSSIARLAAKPAKYAQLLFRIARFYQLKNILELGTSLGISTAYLATAVKTGNVLSLEGAPAIAELARLNLKSVGSGDVSVITGNFDDELRPALKQLQQVDLVFLDGNHRFEPTLRYFHECLPFANQGSVFIFDDIHWSKEMEQAWDEIKKHPAVMCTIDLFFIGLVFFNTDFKEKQHFTIRY